MSIKSPLNRQFGTQFDSVFDVVKSNPMYDKSGGKIPSLDLNFAKSKSLSDSRSTKNLINFTRASSGTYVGSDGLIKTSPVNLLTYSEQFNQWLKVNGASVTSNQSIAPDGTNTADLISALASAALDSIVYQEVTNQSNKNLVGSIYVKSSGSASTARFFVNGNSGFDRQILDVTLTNEWQRVVLPVFNTTQTNAYVHVTPGDDDNQVKSFYIWGAQLEEGTTATDYIPTGATISGAPRFDHDPVTGESLGLLIEESRTNLAKYSEPDDRSGNGVSGEWHFGDLDPNTEITKVKGPDGVSNSASEMQLATGNGYDTYLLSVPVTSGASYTFSAWVKLGTATNLALHVNNTASYDSVPDGRYSFDVNDGLNTNTFVKVSHTFTAPSNGSVNVHIGRHNGTSPAQQTQGTVTVWGCQLELGAFRSSTIITTGSTVTRAADVADITGTNFSSWFNSSELQGTVFSEVTAKGISGTDAVFAIGSNGDVDRWLQQYLSGSSTFYEYEQGPTGHPITIGTPIKSSCGRIAGDNACALNGAIVQTDTYSGTYNPVFLKIGVSGDPNRTMNGHISRLAYFPTRLLDDKLKSITT